MPISMIFGAALMLLMGVLPMPYDYYVVLRIVATVVFTWAAVINKQNNQLTLMWTCIGLTLLFNPFFLVHLTAIIWKTIDVLAAVFLIMIRKQIKSNVF